MEERGTELFIGLVTEMICLAPDCRHPECCPLGGLPLKHKPSKRQQLCGQSFRRPFPLGNLIIRGGQSHRSGLKALFINCGEKNYQIKAQKDANPPRVTGKVSVSFQGHLTWPLRVLPPTLPRPPGPGRSSLPLGRSPHTSWPQTHSPNKHSCPNPDRPPFQWTTTVTAACKGVVQPAVSDSYS